MVFREYRRALFMLGWHSSVCCALTRLFSDHPDIRLGKVLRSINPLLLTMVNRTGSLVVRGSNGCYSITY